MGIPGWSTGENSWGATKTYLDWCGSLGMTPRILMPEEEFVPVDMLLLPGGPDLNPANYNQAPSFYTGGQDVFKEFFYRERLKNYVDKEIPIFGICLGHQMLNVFFGGKLEQHLVGHPDSEARRVEGHKINFVCRNPKSGVMTDWKAPVNSHHHQGVLQSQVADCFDVVAVEDCKGGNKVVEAMIHKTLPIASVQYHPEEWSLKLTDWLINKIMGTGEFHYRPFED